MLLFPDNKNIYSLICTFLILLCSVNYSNAQNAPVDSLFTSTTSDTADTVKQTLWPSLLASAVIPGLGQIRQENPGRAVIFYSSSLYLLFNTIDNYRRYNNDGNTEALSSAQASLALLSQVYLINLLDVLDTYLTNSYQPWPQDLYSDMPIKSPWGAVARSAMLPGWGQVYNEQYIKAVIGFGAFAYFFSRIYHFNQEYRKTGNTEFRDNRVTNSWYLGLTYLIIMIDAYVDAHLYRFDEAMQAHLTLMPQQNSMAVKLGVTIAF
jgi:hypothetical protein